MIGLGVGLLASYAYFYQAGGWNQNSRFALVRAVLEQHTLRIDAYKDTTGDRALWRGHYYSDKAPGLALLAIVPTQLAAVAARAAGVDPGSTAGVAWTSYAATVATCGLFTVVASLSIVWLATVWGYSLSAAFFAATAYAVAGPAWCYATLFMGHALTAGCLMVAFASAVALGDASGPHASRLAWLLGLFAGWAVVSEFPAAIPAALIVVFALWTVRRKPFGTFGGTLARIVGGGSIAAAVLLAYDAAAFGSAFHIGYASEEGFEELHAGLFGVTYPQLWRVEAILIGSYRGLLPISPLVTVTPLGLVMLGRNRRTLAGALVAGGIALFYLALNASYYYWEGGWAYGPRHIVPALPFLALGLLPLWDWCGAATRSLLVGGWIWGAALTLIAVSTTPQPPGSTQRPVTELLLPAFLNGELALNNQGFTDYRADAATLRSATGPKPGWNLGMRLGLRGHASLVPLALVWLACAAPIAAALTEPKPSRA
jgi:hypothetical protein